MNALIETRKITKAFPGTIALNKVDFNLLPGEIHAIAGENGAGKSTLMLLMAGVYQPDGGSSLSMANRLNSAILNTHSARVSARFSRSLLLLPT